MDISRSIRWLRSISSLLRLLAVLDIVGFAALSLKFAFGVTLGIPADVPQVVADALPAAGVIGGAVLLLIGLLTSLTLMAVAELIPVFIAIEENSRKAAEAAALKPAARAEEPVPAGAA